MKCPQSVGKLNGLLHATEKVLNSSLLEKYLERNKEDENSSFKIETICPMGSFSERKENDSEKPSGKDSE